MYFFYPHTLSFPALSRSDYFSFFPKCREWKIGNVGTLGFDAFVVAQTFCDNISLFGFYPFYADPDGKPLRYHYFDDVLSYNFDNTRVHNFGKEYKILQKLDAEKKLKLVAGSCSL